VALILDTGPLYASLDRNDADHAASCRLIETSDEALVIPAPVLVEVDYWVHTRMHAGVFIALLDDIAAGAYRIEALIPEGYGRGRDLRDQYADAIIGFVDAAVMAVVERLGEKKLATLDHRHFGMFRPRHARTLRLLPEPPNP
jgi:uncharacterized protein